MDTSAHPLQTVTLAIWLSVIAFGVVGLVWKPNESSAELRIGQKDGTSLIDARLKGDFTAASDPTPGEPRQVPVLAVAQPPQLQPIPELGPLPELPERPVKVETPADHGPVQAPSDAVRTTANQQTERPKPQASGSGRNVSRDPRPTAGGGGAGGDAESNRLAKGTMPKPNYPREAQRRGQEGGVLVEFTIDASGRVVSAEAVKPSRWPLLNREAIRAVRRWKFPAGDVMTVRRPVIFKLR